MSRALPIAIIALSLVATAATAGRKDTSPVVIDTVNRNAGGTLGDTRDDPDPNAYIRCEVMSSVGSSVANCVACNVKDCVWGWSTDPEIIDTIRSLSSNGAIYFQWLPAGELEVVDLYTGSNYKPVQP